MASCEPSAAPQAGEEKEAAPVRTRRGVKLGGQNISLTSSQQLWKKKEKKMKCFGRTCDMGLWFLAASFST